MAGRLQIQVSSRLSANADSAALGRLEALALVRLTRFYPCALSGGTVLVTGRVAMPVALAQGS